MEEFPPDREELGRFREPSWARPESREVFSPPDFVFELKVKLLIKIKSMKDKIR